MKKTFITLLLASTCLMAFSQLNMTLLDKIDYTQDCNDIWGWVDPDDGTEYALVGTVTGLSIVSLADPTDIQEVQFIPGPNSTWRDIKTWGNFAYVTNETSNGVLVVDMSGAPDNITWYDWIPNIPGFGQLNRCHNLYIDEFGYCYLSGCNLNSGGVLIVDVFSTPGQPAFVGASAPVYSHDSYARNNILYSSQINAGTLGIYDVSNKSNVTLLASQQTPMAFTHNAWLNDDGDVVFTTDERPNAPIAAYDISNLGNIKELFQFKPIKTLGKGVIPHNVHVWQDWLIISYYSDGGIIADASRPDNIIEVGNWDTFLGGDGGYNGAWGAYPFLPSGLVLLTDIANGLSVCGATYVRACWLEGRVTDAITDAPILNASVDIDSPQPNLGATDADGRYKTGQAIAGTFDVTFSAVGYQSKTVQATLDNGVLTILDVELDPLSSYAVAGQTIKADDGTPVPGAKIFLDGDQSDYNAVSDANGNVTFPSILGGEYTLYAGAWGYLHEAVTNFTVDDNVQPFVITLKKGYQDDFILDLGWTETHDASVSGGIWVRGEPVGTTTNNGQPVNPDFDVPNDLGDQCYVTGNGGGAASFDDIDNGIVRLFSPTMDLSDYSDPTLKYTTWFFNGGPFANPNDSLVVRISNGSESVLLEKITQSGSVWRPVSQFKLKDYITLTDNMQVIFQASDLPGSGHWVEAAVDALLVEDVPPYPFFTASATQGCTPFTVEFNDSSDSTATWLWTFEGGSPATSTEQNPVVTYDTPGTYDVSLTVLTNAGNTYTVEQSDFVVVGMAPTAGFTFAVNGSTVTFTNTSTGTGSYVWMFGNGFGSPNPNPTHTYQAPGTYTVTLTVTNGCGSDTYSQEVVIDANIAPTAQFSPGTTTGCVPLTVEFTDQSTGNPTSWSWSFPGGTPATSTEQNPSVTYTTPGTYDASLTVTNGVGSNQVTKTQLILVNNIPFVDFTFSVSAGTVTFTNTSQNATSYQWNFGNGTTSQSANPTVTYAQNGNYDVTLTASNECGFAVFTQTVQISGITAVFELDETNYKMTSTPNPFREQATVNYELSQPVAEAKLLVFNVLGERLAALPLDAMKGSVQVNQQIPSSGVYFLRLMVDGKIGKALRVAKM
jgi:choice-of-anchor B domain-containing protein